MFVIFSNLFYIIYLQNSEEKNGRCVYLLLFYYNQTRAYRNSIIYTIIWSIPYIIIEIQEWNLLLSKTLELSRSWSNPRNIDVRIIPAPIGFL